jgi:hypothetical protein
MKVFSSGTRGFFQMYGLRSGSLHGIDLRLRMLISSDATTVRYSSGFRLASSCIKDGDFVVAAGTGGRVSPCPHCLDEPHDSPPARRRGHLTPPPAPPTSAAPPRVGRGARGRARSPAGHRRPGAAAGSPSPATLAAAGSLQLDHTSRGGGRNLERGFGLHGAIPVGHPAVVLGPRHAIGADPAGSERRGGRRHAPLSPPAGLHPADHDPGGLLEG